MSKICDECETVAHCTKHGCIPKQPLPVKDNSNYRLDPPEAEPAQPAPVQEPVATCKQHLQVEQLLNDMLDTLPYNSPEYWIGRIKEVLPLYTTPPAQPEPVQEPFGYVYEVYCLPECALEMEWVEGFDRYQPDAKNNIRNVTPVYTTPPAAQRQWKGLTDDDYVEMGISLSLPFWQYKAIEAKLKEKNT